MNRKIMLLIITFMSFFIGIQSIEAKEVTCEWRIISPNYYYSDGVPTPGDGSGVKVTGKVTYSSKNKRLSEPQSMWNAKYNNTFSDNNLENEIKSDGKCPTYVQKTGKNGMKSIDENEFVKALTESDKLINKNNRYVLFLYKQNGKEVYDGLKTYLNTTTKVWKEIQSSGGDSSIGTDNKSSKEKIEKAETQFIANAANLGGANYYNKHISTNSNWNSFLKNVNRSEAISDSSSKKTVTNVLKINDAENNLSKLYKNPCSVYCTLSNATAGDKTCETVEKPKCENAYKTCSNISSSSDQDNCVKENFKKLGLNQDFFERYRQQIDQNQSDLQKAKYSLKEAVNFKLNVDFEGAKLSCKDISFLHDFWVAITVLAPILTILFSLIDLFKSVIASDEQKILKARKNIPKRLIACLLIYFVVVFIVVISSAIYSGVEASNTDLLKCVVSGK